MRLRTFGALTITSDSGVQLQRRQLALLAVLAAAGPAGVTRDRLLGLLWADQEPERGRHALDQSLYGTRRAIGAETVVAGPTSFVLDSLLLPSDVAEFEQARERGDLEAAVAVYAGPFLDGVYVADAPEFERWTEGRRKYFADGFVQALSRLAAAASAKGDHAGAAAHLRRAAASDPLSGTVAQALMLALAAAGDRSAAIDVGRVHATLVKSELEAVADTGVRNLMEQLRAGSNRASPRATAPAAPPTPAAGQTPLENGLGGRYHIVREIGAGGMGTVYLARDVTHDRDVALKVLRPQLGALLGAERFLNEIRISARLDHPHILTLIDSGTVAGAIYCVLPYVSGGSLRARLDRERQLPIDDAISIARQIAAALDYAHRVGIVHRDIKPENILFREGDAVLTDFGIAVAVREAGGQRLTESGFSLGTPQYMSPEQATGDQTLDGRSDLYSLAAVLYEMLTGEPPHSGATVQAVIAKLLTERPTPVRVLRDTVSKSLESTVMRGLAKARVDRFSSVAAFSAALSQGGVPFPPARRRRRLALYVATGAAVLVAGSVALLRRPTVSSSEAPVQSIAVLPFKNVGGDSTNEPFSDGMSDELTTALGKVDGLRVAARSVAFRFKGKNVDPEEIGRQLHVVYVLDGSVRVRGNRRRVSAQLINVAGGNEIWSEQYDRDARDRDVFAVQDEITRAITAALRMHLSGAATAALAKRSTESPEAHDLYLQGRYFFAKRDSASLRKARDYFERAIERDSSYALAYAGLSDAYSHWSVFGYGPPRAMYGKAKAAAERSLALDSTLAEAHTSAGFIALFFDWDLPVAAREFDRALAINPTYPDAHLFQGWYYVAIGRVHDAVEAVRTAVKVDPFSQVNNARLASMYYYARQYDEELAQSRRTVELFPHVDNGRVELARSYVQLGQCVEALALVEDIQDQGPSFFRGLLGYANAKCGKRSRAVAEIAHLKAEAAAGRYVSHYGIATIRAALGDTEQAFVELDSAYGERAAAMVALGADPAFDGLRADPRFARLLGKIGAAERP